MNNPVIGLPGVGVAITAVPREIFAGNVQFAQFIPGVHVIDGSNSRNPLNTGEPDVLWAGMLFGQISSTRKFAPSIIGVTTAAYTAAGTTLTVAPTVAAEIVRRVGTSGTAALTLVGPPTSGGTIASQAITYSVVNTSTGAITITALSANAIAGSFICPVDGSQTIKTILGDRWGVKVTDYTGFNSVDVLEEQFILTGHIRSTNIANWPTDTSLIAYIKAALRVFSPAMTFEDDYL